MNAQPVVSFGIERVLCLRRYRLPDEVFTQDLRNQRCTTVFRYEDAAGALEARTERLARWVRSIELRRHGALKMRLQARMQKRTTRPAASTCARAGSTCGRARS